MISDFDKTAMINTVYVVLKRAEDMCYEIRLQDLMTILYYTQLTHIKTYGHIMQNIAKHHAMESGPMTDDIRGEFLTKEFEFYFPTEGPSKFLSITPDLKPNLDYLSRSEVHCLVLETEWFVNTPLGVKQKRLNDSKAYTNALAKAKTYRRKAWPMEWIDIVRSAGVESCNVDFVLENIENCYIDLSEWELF